MITNVDNSKKILLICKSVQHLLRLIHVLPKVENFVSSRLLLELLADLAMTLDSKVFSKNHFDSLHAFHHSYNPKNLVKYAKNARFCKIVPRFSKNTKNSQNSYHNIYTINRRPKILQEHCFIMSCLSFPLRPKKKALVSGNAGDEKNLHPGVRRFIFFNRFSGDILFSSLVSLFSFILVFFVCLFVVF